MGIRKSSYKNFKCDFITYKSRPIHTTYRGLILDKIKSGNILTYTIFKNGLSIFEDDLACGYAKAALLFTILFPVIGNLIWRKELDNDIRTM